MVWCHESSGERRRTASWIHYEYHLHLTTIDIEDFFIGLYLTRVHDEGFILPNRLHQLARERLEKWFKESSWILGQMPMVSTESVLVLFVSSV
ncbi:hypothetical protein K439DRAFT_203499 [Ramaria rubella]|nr:hypothetical protein K439DRAFT_203499 [Ramaria rubella]